MSANIFIELLKNIVCIVLGGYVGYMFSISESKGEKAIYKAIQKHFSIKKMNTQWSTIMSKMCTMYQQQKVLMQ